MSSEKEPNLTSPKLLWPIAPASAAQPSPKSNRETATSPLAVSKKLPSSLAVRLTSSLNPAQSVAMMLNLSVASTPREASSSTPGRSSKPSTKRTKRGIPKPDADVRLWKVELHPAVAKDFAHYGLSDPAFTPTLHELIDALETNPKQFKKKRGPIAGTRAAALKYHNVAYRADFILDEAARVVFVLSLDPHDEAYQKARRRLKGAKKRLR